MDPKTLMIKAKRTSYKNGSMGPYMNMNDRRERRRDWRIQRLSAREEYYRNIYKPGRVSSRNPRSSPAIGGAKQRLIPKLGLPNSLGSCKQ